MTPEGNSPANPDGKPAPSFRETDSAAAPASSRLQRGDFRPEKAENPPPRFLPVGYRVPPERMFDATMAAFRAAGIAIEALDRAGGILRGLHPMAGAPSGAAAVAATVIAAISPSDTGGSRLLLSYDRPPGTRMDPYADEKQLKAILERVDEALAR